MKKALWMVAAATALFASCAKDATTDLLPAPEAAGDFTAVIAETRTELGDGNAVLWNSTDELTIFTKTMHNRKYGIKEHDGRNATFTFLDHTGESGQSITSNFALYPYDANATLSIDEAGSGIISTTINAQQVYNAEKVDLANALMVATSDDHTLQFVNAGALIRFNVLLDASLAAMPDTYTIESIVLASASQPLAGQVTINTATDSKAIVADNGTQTVTLTVGEELSTTAAYFYMAMPAVTFAEEELTLTFNLTENGNEKVVVKNLPAFELKQSSIKTITYTIKADDFTGVTPGYEDVWDGTTVTEPEYDEETNTYSISSASDLAYLAQLLNGTLINQNTTRAAVREMNIALESDINLNGEQWIPIGIAENSFVGTFDGQGYTIKNLNIVETEAKEGKAYIGFFGHAKNATIKNVTFENVNLNIACLDIDNSQGHIGAVAGSLEGTSTIENVTVKGDIFVEATFEANGASRVAVVAGGNIDGNVTMRNVHVVANEGSYLKANNNVGALAGQLQVKNVFENCSSNIDVTAKKFYAGGIIGLAAGDSQFINCHTTGNMTVTGGREGRHNDEYRVGGIAGGWADNVKTPCVLTNCTYTGEISGTNTDGAVADPLDYAGYVGRGYTLTNCAGSKVIIDGVYYVQKYNNEYGIYDVYAVGAITEQAGVKGVVYEITDKEVKVVSVAELNLNGKNWDNAMAWAEELGEGWVLASMEDLNTIYDLRCELNDALEADNAENALFWEGDYLYIKNGNIYYALYISSTEAPAGELDELGREYYANRVFFKMFNAKGYSDVLYSSFDCINKYAPYGDNYFARAVYTIAL